jgi:histidine triad (HIT) family protein
MVFLFWYDLAMDETWMHEPTNYECPFCLLIAGGSDEYSSQDDIVYQNEYTTAKISPKWWVNNPGHVIVVPNEHFENIYDVPEDTLAEVYKTVKQVCLAIRSTYECDGISTRQHNEPAGNQDVWHLHVHVFPRYINDNLYLNHEEKSFVGAEERLPYAEKLRAYFKNGAI